MENFTYYNPTKIIFGRGVESKVGVETGRISNKILLHSGGESARKTGLYDRVISSLRENNINYVELAGVQPNPRLEMVRQGINLCRKHNLTFILAVGGGSVIDSAKAIAAGVPYNGDVWDFFTGQAKVTAALPIGTILTIPAAGSEASSGSVITNEQGWYKRAFGSSLVYPRFSFLNPELAFTLPRYQIACGAVDIISHLTERYFTNSSHVELTDRLIESTLKTVAQNTTVVLEHSDNYDSWAEIMWGGTVAHNNLLDTGRISDWGSHDIEHELSAIYDIAHGGGLAIVVPAWMKYVYSHDINRFAQFAVRVWNVENNFWSPEQTALEGIRRHQEFFKSLGLPTTLTEAGLPTDRLEEMAAKCTSNDTKTTGNFIKLNQKDVLNILKLAI